MIKVDGLHVERSGRTILTDINFAVAAGSFVAVVGPNGSGKSTLLKALTGEVGIAAGDVELQGQPLSYWVRRPRASARWRAVVAQTLPVPIAFTALDIVLMGRTPHNQGKLRREDLEMCRGMLVQMEAEHLSDRRMETLSGGERQRVHIARALAQIHERGVSPQAPLLFLDEATANLDILHQLRVLEIATELKRSGATVFFVIHDLGQAMRFADQVLLLENGKLLASGDPRAALSSANIEQAFHVQAEWVSHNGVELLSSKLSKAPLLPSPPQLNKTYEPS